MEKKKYTYNYTRTCEICNKEFVTQRYSTKLCSSECVSSKLSSQKKKYTQEQLNLAISLKISGVLVPNIVKQTGINKNSLTKLFRERNIKLSKEAHKIAVGSRWKNHEPIKDGKKQCSKCKEWKLIDLFHANNNRISKTVSSCIECAKLDYEKNSEKIKQRVDNYRKNNVEKVSLTSAAYYEKNKEKYIEKASNWSSNNPENRKKIEIRYNENNPRARAFRSSIYRAKKANATPKWLTKEMREEIREIYKKCPKGHHVDHIVPLAGEDACGLHVPWNLQYLPKYQNESKGNKSLEPITDIGTCHQFVRKMETREEDISNGLPENAEISEFEFFKEPFALDHRMFIERYEWLGTIGYAPKWVFTARYKGILGGVIIVTEPNAYTSKAVGKELEAQITRGATASWTPKNLGSKLVAFSCKWMANNTPKRVFFGYSDPEAGEIGTIYQACNFKYLGGYFGAVSRYQLPNGRLVSSRYFSKTSTYKKYAKELEIKWLPEWEKENRYMDQTKIPKEILQVLKNKSEFEKNKCDRHKIPPKGKYVLILGRNKRNKKEVDDLYSKIWGESMPYPKRNV